MPASNRIGLCAIVAGVSLLLQPTLASAQTAGDLPPFPDGSHDFDFLIGSWKAHLRKLVNPLTGSTTWIQFDGTSVTRKLLDTNANLEDFHVKGPNGERNGHTLRLYNPKSGQWSIYLTDLKAGQLSPPAVVGRFVDGKGELVDQEEFGGRMILVRYQWTPQGPTRAHMEQSFSDDNGRTWEANWIIDLTREGP
jgi:hypothetical protein